MAARSSKAEVTIDVSALNGKNKNLKLIRTCSDEFNDWQSFREDRDIGNPGYNRPKIGNDGCPESVEVKFEDGLRWDRYGGRTDFAVTGSAP